MCVDYLFVHRNMQLLFLCIFNVYKAWKVEAVIFARLFFVVVAVCSCMFFTLKSTMTNWTTKTKPNGICWFSNEKLTFLTYMYKALTMHSCTCKQKQCTHALLPPSLLDSLGNDGV